MDSQHEGSPKGAVPPSRFGPGFGWGLAAGALIAVAIAVVVGFVALRLAELRLAELSNTPRGYPPGASTVNPVGAGEPWFSVGADGKGSLRGWSLGTSGGFSDRGARGTLVEYVDVGAPGVIDHVTLTHTVRVVVMRETQLLVDGKPYRSPLGYSAVQTLVGGTMDATPFSDRALTIDFHRAGSSIIADRVSTSERAPKNPLRN